MVYGLWAYPTAATLSFSVKYLMCNCIAMGTTVSTHSTAGQHMSAYLDTSSRHLATTMLRTCHTHHLCGNVLARQMHIARQMHTAALGQNAMNYAKSHCCLTCTYTCSCAPAGSRSSSSSRMDSPALTTTAQAVSSSR